MKKLPFIELHCHLDGSITVDIARKLAALQGMELVHSDAELYNQLSVPESCTDLNEFLERFALPCSLMQTKESVTESMRLVQERYRKEGAVYLEIRFAPQKHCDKGLTQEDVILAALEGLKQSELHTNIILCLMRDKGNEKENLKTVELAKKYLVEDGGVVAIDLAGAEALFPTKDFAYAFDKAREYGIPFTIHAGEAAGSESVASALDLGAARIGHGVWAGKDSAVLDRVVKNGIVLEMCPTSNRQTRSVLDMSEYPLKKYLEMGVKVTINTDDPSVCGTSISREFDYIVKEFGITEAQIKTMLLNAADAAFTNSTTKDGLRQLIGSAF